MSFLALSIAAPMQLLDNVIVRRVLDIFPILQNLAADPRYIALTASALVALLMVIKNLMFAYVTLLCTKFGELTSLYTGDILFHQYLFSPYTWHLAGDSAEVFQGLAWRKILAATATRLMDVYTYFAITIALCITVVIFTPVALLIAIIVLGIMAFIIYRLLRKHMEEAGINVAEWAKSENKVTLNAMRGIREILIYRQQPIFFEKFRSANTEGMKDRAFLNLAPPIPTWTLETAGFFIIFAAIFILININHASMGEITGVVTIIMLTSWRVLPILNRALSTLISLKGSQHSAMESLKQVEEALKHPASEPDEPDPNFKFEKSIELKDASFSYGKLGSGNLGPTQNQEEAPAIPETPLCLSEISLVIPKGKRIGLIGRSGAGKSTLSLLLSGLAPPNSGEIRIDGKKLEDSTLTSYRALVGFVPQNPYIMGGTIAENIAFCQWGLPWDEEKVLKVCQMAEFDVALERGINATLGQDGAGLSGGQAQRLSIARALYADPLVLIFDEATSALDTGVEKAIMETIFDLPRDITTITIAHRLDTVRKCDIIFWLEKGKLMASGPPEEILPQYEAFLDNKAKEMHQEHISL